MLAPAPVSVGALQAPALQAPPCQKVRHLFYKHQTKKLLEYHSTLGKTERGVSLYKAGKGHYMHIKVCSPFVTSALFSDIRIWTSMKEGGEGRNKMEGMSIYTPIEDKS